MLDNLFKLVHFARLTDNLSIFFVANKRVITTVHLMSRLSRALSWRWSISILKVEEDIRYTLFTGEDNNIISIAINTNRMKI